MAWPLNVCWNSGVMNPSPSPVLGRQIKWIWNISMYTRSGNTIRHAARAAKWRPNSWTGIRTLAHISSSPLIVLQPMVAIVNKPTHLQLAVNPNPRPVKANQLHHQNWKGLGPKRLLICIAPKTDFRDQAYRFFWLWKLIHIRMVMDVKNSKGGSSKIRRLFATKPFSIHQQTILSIALLHICMANLPSNSP